MHRDNFIALTALVALWALFNLASAATGGGTILDGGLPSLPAPQTGLAVKPPSYESRGPELELLFSEGKGINPTTIEVSGDVKNISGRTVADLAVQVDWQTRDGQFIKSESVAIDENPLAPGRVSFFRLRTAFDPSMEKYRISFRTFNGEQLPVKDSRQR
jgi:hypothetical protein